MPDEEDAVGIVETNGLTKYYGNHRGIIDVSFTIEEGEIFGFIGPNGAGKSTTIRSLLGLIFPTSGKARVLGLDAVKESKTIKQRVGYLPADVEYYENMSTRELLLYSARFYGVDAKRAIGDLAERFDVDLKRPISDLSSGNKKKVSILQCFIHKPELIILDEPTNGLDPLMQNRFYQLVKQEQERGATIFFSSHILNEVERVCGRVAVVKEGRIIATENVADLRRKHVSRVHISFNGNPARADIAASGISDWSEKNGDISFLFTGDPNDLIRGLSNQSIRSITIEEPSLEDVFMHYYQDEEA